MAEPNYEPAIYWCRERDAIRKRRIERQQAIGVGISHTSEVRMQPLTADPILREWRFCNVRREDDRVTVWIDRNIRKPYASHPLLWLMLCLARQINFPATLYALICMYPGAWPSDDAFTPNDLWAALADRECQGLKNYTGVYIISAPPGGGTKPRYTAMEVIGKLYADREKLAPLFLGSRAESMQRAHAALMRYNGWGPFLAYQAIVDMRFTNIFREAKDVNSWCAAGPGTLRGLNRIYGRELTFKSNQDRARDELVKMWPILVQESGVQMDLSDVPNVMCETDKYLRVKNGEGQPRNRFRPNMSDWSMDHAEG